MTAADEAAPILRGKRYGEPSAFTPQNLLREARRQRGLRATPVPRVCVLDPDGDLVRHASARGRCARDPDWACYHTGLHRLVADDREGTEIGVVPFAVGSAFAVLVAEELFAAGCELLIGMTSAGQLVPCGAPPYFVLIERALRDEGTSYHYLPPAPFSEADAGLMSRLAGAFEGLATPVHAGAVWTTDAPFRETAQQIEAAKAQGLLAVEMEASALYAFARACRRPVVCVAHVTNQMGTVDGDFEKGEADGSVDALAVILRIARRLTAPA